MGELVLGVVLGLASLAVYLFGKKAKQKPSPVDTGPDITLTLEEKIRREMKRLADRRGIPFELIKAQVMKESGGGGSGKTPLPGARIDKVNARGTTGEIGLMQIKPIVLREYNTDHETTFPAEKLWEYDFNLEVGTWYLAKQKRRFGTWKDALIAYNIGPTKFANEGASNTGLAYSETILSWAGLA